MVSVGKNGSAHAFMKRGDHWSKSDLIIVQDGIGHSREWEAGCRGCGNWGWRRDRWFAKHLYFCTFVLLYFCTFVLLHFCIFVPLKTRQGVWGAERGSHMRRDSSSETLMWVISSGDYSVITFITLISVSLSLSVSVSCIINRSTKHLKDRSKL